MLEKIDAFWKKRYEEEKDSVKLARNRNDGRLEHDVAFLKKHLTQDQTVLDLGAGPAVLANAISPFCKEITCVEKQACDWQKAIKAENVRGVTSDAIQFLADHTYDVILIFGVVNHLTEKEAETLYQNCKKMMHPSSLLILKSQFGVKEDLYIDHFSEELQMDYQSHYRTVEHEMEIAKGAFKYEVFDIYPDHLNPYENTRHYHVVCTLK